MRWVGAAINLGLRDVHYYNKDEDKKAILRDKRKESYANRIQLIVKGVNKKGEIEYWAIFPDGVALRL